MNIYQLMEKFPWLAYVRGVSEATTTTLIQKEEQYGGSWQRRGGVGAFMMTARKTDRIETICERHGYDIFAATAENDSGIIDDIEDCIAYFTLILAMAKLQQAEETGEVPVPVVDTASSMLDSVNIEDFTTYRMTYSFPSGRGDTILNARTNTYTAFELARAADDEVGDSNAPFFVSRETDAAGEKVVPSPPYRCTDVAALRKLVADIRSGEKKL